MRRWHAYLIVTLAAALPRLVVLGVERHKLLEDFVEKSDRFAQTFVQSGTFGFLPGVPSAYTQPLYAFFLSGLYWPFGRSWVAVGLAQTVVAVATALLVLELGRRLRSLTVGVVAALVATLHPYVVWHDVHINREILDGLIVVALALLALMAYERRSVALAAAAGAVCGLGILGNSRLLLLPLALAPFVAWRIRPGSRAVAAGAVLVLAAALVVTPWVIRNRVQVGCFAVTTDARALWKANNLSTRDVLASGKWIDDVPELPGAPPWPELAADRTLGGTATSVDECEQVSLYRDEVLAFWRDEPGEKARLAVQAVQMLWSPTFTVTADDPARNGVIELAKKTVEPAYVIAIYALAIFGLFLAPRRFAALVALLVSYNTLMAMVFAGTFRYRTPFDALLAVLAAFALERGWTLVQSARRDYSTAARESASR
jgi:hypothetical protein